MLDSAAILTAGQIVPDYDLLRRIGAGSYGEVWLARSKATGVLRAAKIVWRHTFDNERPFQREFEGIQRFEGVSRGHSSQLVLFHIGRNDDEGCFYYVMELADNVGTDADYAPRTLRADLGEGRLPASRVLEIGLALTEALGHLHQNGLVHRDVKPPNVIFVGGRPKLADIGLVTDASDTRSIVGTEGYLPPEGPGTPRADIFALGKVLYEAVTGLDRREFPKLPEDIRAWADRDAVFELNEIVIKACAEDYRKGYRNCDELKADLALLQQGRSVKESRASGLRRSVARKMLLGGLAIAVVAAGGWLLKRELAQPPSLSQNKQAVKLYQEALYEIKSDTVERRGQAYTNLIEAIKLDPGFVGAYYAMTEVYFDSYVGDRLPPHYDWGANERDATEKLRRIAPNSAQYHTANAMGKFWTDWQIDAAIEEAKLATEIDPRFMRAHANYALYIWLGHGDSETALREFNIAEQLDPTDMTVQINKAVPSLQKGDFESAINQIRKALQLEPRTTQLHLNLADVYDAAGQYEKALDEYEQFDLLNGKDSEKTKAWYQTLRVALSQSGPRAVWQARLARIAEDTSPDEYRMAQLDARLGRTDEVFRLLNSAYDHHNGGMVFLMTDDWFASMRGDERFQQLIKKMGFHPVAGAIR
jgi:serine/threonine protein kinase